MVLTLIFPGKALTIDCVEADDGGVAEGAEPDPADLTLHTHITLVGHQSSLTIKAVNRGGNTESSKEICRISLILCCLQKASL